MLPSVQCSPAPHPTPLHPQKKHAYSIIWRTFSVMYVTDIMFKQQNGMRYCFTLPLQITKLLIWKWQEMSGIQTESYEWWSQYTSQGQFTTTISKNILRTMFYSGLGARSMADSRREEPSLEELPVSFDRNDAITWVVKVVDSSVLPSGMWAEPSAGCTKRFRHS